MEPAPYMKRAFSLLLQAHEYVLESGRDRWDFAVEIGSLREFGLTNNDLRWLLYNKYAHHAVEVTASDDDRRLFRPRGKLLLSERSCFVLTEEGLAVAVALAGSHELPLGGNAEAAIPNGKVARPGEQVQEPSSNGTPASPGRSEDPRPRWHKDRRMLTFGDRLVKQFKVPASNQEIILAAFEEEHWPVRMDDPLPVHPSIDPKRRLHDTISSLNRNQRITLLRFQGDGSGQAVCWEPIFSDSPSADWA
jgi:hypothetical protein